MSSFIIFVPTLLFSFVVVVLLLESSDTSSSSVLVRLLVVQCFGIKLYYWERNGCSSFFLGSNSERI